MNNLNAQHRYWPRMAFACAFLVILFSVAHLLQRTNGALDNESGTFADEASHYVTCLMVADYLRTAVGKSPMEFAQDYYLHYPKVAIGHWGPSYYGVGAIWSLMFGDSRDSLVTMMAVFAACIGLAIFQLSRRYSCLPLAFAATALFLLNPVVQRHYMTVMTELFSVAMFLLATNAYADFLTYRRWHMSCRFAAFASIAILIKGNGFILALLPIVATTMTYQWSVIKDWKTYLSVAIVVVICLPWYLMTLSFQVDGLEPLGLDYLLSSIPFFSRVAFTIAGVVVSPLAIIGAVFAVQKHDRMMITHLSLVICVLLFHYVVPCGHDPRHFLIIVPSLLVLAASGTQVVIDHALKSKALIGKLVFAFALVAVNTLQLGMKPIERWGGFKNVARYDEESAVIFVSGDERTEGMLVEQIAFQDQRPDRYVVRGSKLLSESQWGGENYEAKFSNTKVVVDLLRQIPVQLIIIDRTHGDYLADHELVDQMLRENPELFSLKAKLPIIRNGQSIADGLHIYAVHDSNVEVAGIKSRLKKLVGDRFH